MHIAGSPLPSVDGEGVALWVAHVPRGGGECGAVPHLFADAVACCVVEVADLGCGGDDGIDLIGRGPEDGCDVAFIICYEVADGIVLIVASGLIFDIVRMSPMYSRRLDLGEVV